MWKSQGGNWEKVTNGTASADVTLPATIPLKIEGMAVGNADVTASFQLTTPNAAQSIADTAKVAVYKINATATGLKMGSDGYLVRAQTAECSELDKITPGVFIHYNLDDDNHNQSSTITKHPGADEKDTTAESSEDDLLPLKIDVMGLPDGKLTLFTNYKILIWKDKEKGNTNKLFTTKDWDLTQSDQKSDFDSVKDKLFVEGLGSNTDASISIAYAIKVDKVSLQLPLTTINYHSIAADDGNQPYWKKPIESTPDDSTPRDDFHAGWPQLVDCEFSILNAKNPSYNCWAWSVQRSDAWIGSTLAAGTKTTKDPSTGITYIDIGQMWGGHVGPWTTADFDAYYQHAGVEPGKTPLGYSFVPTTNVDEAEILLYRNSAEITHGARKHSPTQGDMGKWRMFESKLADLRRSNIPSINSMAEIMVMSSECIKGFLRWLHEKISSFSLAAHFQQCGMGTARTNCT